VREIVRATTDHLIEHDFKFHDHAGPTRWANYNPESLNNDIRWHVERGLNSLSMLSYLATAHHMTGDAKYLEVAKELREKHNYHQNLLVPKYQRGIGTGNQSDDEMAFMCFYNLIRYEPDPMLKARYAAAFYVYWTLEEPEANPLFNFMYAAVTESLEHKDQWGVIDLTMPQKGIDDAVETLVRFPLDRFNWQHDNSERLDLMWLTRYHNDPLEGGEDERHLTAMRVDGKVVPVDERHFNFWNHNPFELVTGGSGNGLSDGAVFTHPYYMGLYYGFIEE
jgi:hypothetical protein